MYRHLGHGLRSSLRNNGQAYGFSVTITAAAAVLNAEAGRSGSVHLLYFALGAAAGFSLLEAVATGGFRKPLEKEPSSVTALGVSFSVVSVALTVCLSWVAAHFLGGTGAWPLTGFLVSVLYPVGAGMELAAAQRVREAKDVATREEVERDEEERGGGQAPD
ncbi:hypothetical protein [Streptomyces sp. NPDC045251]|uniref:hypothetical protein n=1 Tax=unclassified Streptomyces TaxID=2593676 RepID=UPI0033DA5004